MAFQPIHGSRRSAFSCPRAWRAFRSIIPQKPHVKFVTLEFTQKPSDVLIGILGSLLEISSNALRRRDERIVLTPESMKRIGLIVKGKLRGNRRRRTALHPSGSVLWRRQDPHQHASARPQAESKVLLKLAKCELKDDTVLDGAIVRVEDVQGRNDLVALSIQFSTDPPISYKQKINSFFSTQVDAE